MTDLDSYHYWHTIGLCAVVGAATLGGQYWISIMLGEALLLSLAVFDWRVNPDRYEDVFDDVDERIRVGHLAVHLLTFIYLLAYVTVLVID